MLKNPFEKSDNPTMDSETSSVDLSKPTDDLKMETAELTDVDLPTVPSFELPTLNEDKYRPSSLKAKQEKRDVEYELSDEEYHQRLQDLNTNADNKHYVLFFGQPAAGKTWIIGSVLHYMKNYLGGTVYLDTTKTTESEEELFYQLQDRFNGILHAKKITSTETKQYFEFHISFTPKDSTKPPMNIVFIDASGEHSEQAFRRRGKVESGKLPNYLTAILESKVQTKLAFVYDQSLVDEKDAIPQVNVLSEVFTIIQQIQQNQKKTFPKALLLSKADKIYATDSAAVERNGYDPMSYALEKIPSFANSFFNESPENRTIFYKIGTFSANSDLILEFDKECPERFFRWLYKEGSGVSVTKEPTCWDKFMGWFRGA